ncbi:MAG: hypothetical protein A2087_08930 [Spirochaetes bacterium GWD1_61_31]|nr:MAG: hypothetical protein A2Y37_13445 [Spirochaetes bacterium GWB1_60_80]OHD30050.1 MAG: hypothetical protein A2004_03515 [Spirochaetes bacterium GWC1_61_12]OHD42557.1 MAG: hypothetical protein A2087_08930 [Spirochaetes bacterium GWD1_61_31]OHD45057.1 MAG: hypothetical protein A2Y35_12665 [Spirochaetes bacterium GWE1_60_18]OHD59985.1 MAG: hypothetical protein A2Y32_14515 [Spirochaetes bacterium GWF1_60_12]HAP42954.1 hypothetical protein [Spirochaetaceae bacterium]
MKKICWLIVFCLTVGLSAQALRVGEAEVEVHLNLRYDVIALARLAGQDDAATILAGLAQQDFLLRGALGAVASEAEDPYQLIVTLQSAAWQDDFDLQLFVIYLLVDDPAFDEYFRGMEGQQVMVLVHAPVLITDAAGQLALLVRVRSLLAL